MITVRARRCQTLCALVAASLLLLAVARAGPPPAPPAWQQEIDAARLLEDALALVPAKDAAEQDVRRSRLQGVYRQLAQKYAGEAAVQKATGDYFTRDGQPAAALPFWEKAVQIAPRDAGTLDRLGGAYVQLGRTREAYTRFQQAVEAQPDVAAYHSDLANVLYLFRHDLMSPPIPALPDEQAALAQALAHFRRASELAPEDIRLAQAYAETFYIFAKPDWTQALAAWEAVRVLSGEKSDFANSHLARISLRLSKPDAAAEYLARIHDPLFDALKGKLLQKVEQQRGSPERRQASTTK